MDVVYSRCCGIDIHKRIAVACVIVSQKRGRARKESTGVYWKAPFNLLEGQFEVLLANAQHIKTILSQDLQDRLAVISSPAS